MPISINIEKPSPLSSFPDCKIEVVGEVKEASLRYKQRAVCVELKRADTIVGKKIHRACFDGKSPIFYEGYCRKTGKCESTKFMLRHNFSPHKTLFSVPLKLVVSVVELNNYENKLKAEEVSDIECFKSSNFQFLRHFRNPFEAGGMTPIEQEVLAKQYKNAESVFEWGMGSSTMIALFMKISRLVAVDSALKWVNHCRTILEKDPSRTQNQNFAFRYSNIGPTAVWGFPANESSKDLWPSYSMEVDQEEKSFDLYLVDGRFRVACAARALLHGTAKSIIIIHDFSRKYYHVILDYAEIILMVGELAFLRRRENSTDTEILLLWETYKFNFE
eukprot:g121.t1